MTKQQKKLAALMNTYIAITGGDISTVMSALYAHTGASCPASLRALGAGEMFRAMEAVLSTARIEASKKHGIDSTDPLASLIP